MPAMLLIVWISCSEERQRERKWTIMTSGKKWKQCWHYAYFDEHRRPVLWRVTDRHITLSGHETNGILPHLTGAATAASTIIPSFIMSNKATHRQTAFFPQTSPTNSSFYNSDEMLKKQTEACSFSLCLRRKNKKIKKSSEVESISRQKQRGNTLLRSPPGYSL